MYFIHNHNQKFSNQTKVFRFIRNTVWSLMTLENEEYLNKWQLLHVHGIFSLDQNEKNEYLHHNFSTAKKVIRFF